LPHRHRDGVHKHFKLVENFTVYFSWKIIILGAKTARAAETVAAKARKLVLKLAA